MAVEKIVNIKVTETGLDEINKDLVSLDKNLDKVSGTGEKAADSVNEVAGNGGAIAILDSLTGGLATRMRDAWEATKLFNTSLKGTRAALIATGIGAIVVALGAIVAYWDEIKILVSDTNFLINDQIKMLEGNKTLLEQQIGILDKRIELNELEGKSNEVLQKQKIALLEQEQALNNTLIEKLEWQLENEKALAREFTLWERIKVEALRIIDPVKAAALESVSQLENNEKTLELQQKINEAKQKQVDLEVELFKIQNPETDVSTPQTRDIGGGVSELDSEKSVIDQKVELFRLGEEEIRRLSEETAAIQRGRREAERIEEEILAQQKLALASQTFGALIDIIGQNSTAGKAAAIAQALINTYAGVTEVWKTESTLPEPFATAARIASTATVLASGLQSVKQIKSTKLPSFASDPGGGGGGVSAPSFNVVGTSGTNQIAEALSQDQQPIKAYVVGSEVTSQQSLDRNIVQTATIVD